MLEKLDQSTCRDAISMHRRDKAFRAEFEENRNTEILTLCCIVLEIQQSGRTPLTRTMED